MAIWLILLFLVVINLSCSKGECTVGHPQLDFGTETTGSYYHSNKYTMEAVNISLNISSIPPRLEILHISTLKPKPSSEKFCIAFNDALYPTHSSSRIPITMQRIYLHGGVFTKYAESDHRYTKNWKGVPTLNFTCKDLVHLGDLDKPNRVSLKGINAVIPPPVLEIYDLTGIMVESYPLDQVVATFGTTTLRLPENMGCRTFQVKVRCASVEQLGEGQSKWYFLSSPSENNSLLIPAIDPPTLLISSTQPMNLKQDPFSSLENVRIENISPFEGNTSSNLTICSQQNCSKDRKEGQLYDLRFKTVFKAPNGELWESCFTSVSPQQIPELKFTLTFQNSVIVCFKNLSDAIERNATFLDGNKTIGLASEKLLSTEFVPSNLNLLCPSEIPNQPEGVIGTIGIRWSQESIVYERLSLQIVAENLVSAERSSWCAFNESSSMIQWKFLGVDDTCGAEFTIQFGNIDNQKPITIKTHGFFEEFNSTFSFGVHLGTIFHSVRNQTGEIVLNVSLTATQHCSVTHNFSEANRSMVSASSDHEVVSEISIRKSKMAEPKDTEEVLNSDVDNSEESEITDVASLVSAPSPVTTVIEHSTPSPVTTVIEHSSSATPQLFDEYSSTSLPIPSRTSKMLLKEPLTTVSSSSSSSAPNFIVTETSSKSPESSTTSHKATNEFPVSLSTGPKIVSKHAAHQNLTGGTVISLTRETSETLRLVTEGIQKPSFQTKPSEVAQQLTEVQQMLHVLHEWLQKAVDLDKENHDEEVKTEPSSEQLQQLDPTSSTPASTSNSVLTIIAILLGVVVVLVTVKASYTFARRFRRSSKSVDMRSVYSMPTTHVDLEPRELYGYDDHDGGATRV